MKGSPTASHKGTRYTNHRCSPLRSSSVLLAIIGSWSHRPRPSPAAECTGRSDGESLAAHGRSFHASPSTTARVARLALHDGQSVRRRTRQRAIEEVGGGSARHRFHRARTGTGGRLTRFLPPPGAEPTQSSRGDDWPGPGGVGGGQPQSLRESMRTHLMNRPAQNAWCGR